MCITAKGKEGTSGERLNATWSYKFFCETIVSAYLKQKSMEYREIYKSTLNQVLTYLLYMRE